MRQGGLVEVLDASARFVGEATRAPGSVVLAAMEGSRPLLVEVQALVVAVASSCRRGASRTGSTATGSRSCSRSSAATPASASAAPTCSSTSPAACASTSPAPTWPSRSRWRAPRAACVAAPASAPIACFGEIGLTGELRTVGHPERRLAEAAKFGLTPTVAPTGAGRGASEAGTLRAALKAALGAAPAARSSEVRERAA